MKIPPPPSLSFSLIRPAKHRSKAAFLYSPRAMSTGPCKTRFKLPRTNGRFYTKSDPQVKMRAINQLDKHPRWSLTNSARREKHPHTYDILENRGYGVHRNRPLFCDVSEQSPENQQKDETSSRESNVLKGVHDELLPDGVIFQCQSPFRAA